MEYSCWNPLCFTQDLEDTEELDTRYIEDLANTIRETAIKLGYPVNKTEIPLTKRLIGREVGDDRVDLSRSSLAIITTITVQEYVVKMRTSWEDTFVTKGRWNFCEVTSDIPTDPYQGYHHCRKVGDFTDLGFNDSIILRIVLDVSKGDESHSSTPLGKMTMLGSRITTPRKELRPYWHLASLFQDAYLSTHRALEPKYLPQVMGGGGVVALFDNPVNIFLYAKAYRDGQYCRIYGTAISELEKCLQYMERGSYSAPQLAPRLRERQDYFWGTYAEKVFIPKKGELPATAGLRVPIVAYEATSGQNRYQAFENRLIRTKHLIPRKQAEQEWERTHRLRNIVDNVYTSTDTLEKYYKSIRTAVRSKFDMALSANTALNNLLKREATHQDVKEMIGNENFRMITSGQRDFTRMDATWVYRNGAKEFYSLNDISISEDMYFRDEVSSEETFKVGGITLDPIYSHSGNKPVVTRNKVGLYEIGSNMEEWAEDLSRRIKERRDELGKPVPHDDLHEIFMEDPEWVNDDSGLIATCMENHAGYTAKQASVVLVTNDRRLTRQMANTCNLSVLRINPRDYILYAGEGYLRIPHPDLLQLRHVGVPPVDKVYLDTGSIAALSATLCEEKGTVVERIVTETGVVRGKRTTSVVLRNTGRPLKIRVEEIQHPIVRPKVWRSHSRPASTVYSSSDHSKDWRGPPTSLPPSRAMSWRWHNRESGTGDP